MRGAVRAWWLFTVAVGLLIAVIGKPQAQPAQGDEALVLAADVNLVQAVRTADKSIARRLLSLEFSFVDEHGKLHTRKDFLADLKGAAASSASAVTVKAYGRIAMVTGHRQSAANGDVFFLDIWAKQKGAWRALAMQNVVLAASDAPAVAPASSGAEAKSCSNPCQVIPYRVRSPIEQDIVNSFQAIKKAVVSHDSVEWSKHIADEYVLYRSGRPPLAKSACMAAIKGRKQNKASATVGEVQDMRLTAYDNGAAMTTTVGAPDTSRPPFRAARVWVKRNSQWLMAISVQTDIR